MKVDFKKQNVRTFEIFMSPRDSPRLIFCVLWRNYAYRTQDARLKKSLPPTPLGQLTRYLVGSIGVTCRTKMLKSFLSEIQDGRHGGHLENLRFVSSPEQKGQLTPNLVGSIGVTCRSKIAKIMPIGNPRWLPWRPS